MRKVQAWRILLLGGLCALIVLAGVFVHARAAKNLEAKEAARLIARVIGFEEKASDVVHVKSIEGSGSSAIVTADVTGVFRFDQREGKWRVAEVRLGDRKWEDVETLARAINDEKRARARAELEAIRAALESFRREQGFYVTADNIAQLFDFLAPRYIASITPNDPWHHPYRYKGAREGFTLSSDGADGKQGTADDIQVSNR
jgi:hypothetical protein